MGGVMPPGGDLGDWTVTLGGERVRERVGDLGGEKATMDVGRGLELALELVQGARRVEERGVGLPFALSWLTLGEDLSVRSRGMSSDMRPSARRPLSSATPRRSAGAGERWRGVAGAGAGAALFALRRFSNWARRDETGFCRTGGVSTCAGRGVSTCAARADVQWTRSPRGCSGRPWCVGACAWVPPGQPAPEGIAALFIDDCEAVPIGRRARGQAGRSCSETAVGLPGNERAVRGWWSGVYSVCLNGSGQVTDRVCWEARRRVYRMLACCKDRRLRRGVVAGVFQVAVLRVSGCIQGSRVDMCVQYVVNQ